MRIKIWASVSPQTPTTGPYRLLDIVEGKSLYAVGEITHYGTVISIPPRIAPFSDDADQSVVVKLDLDKLEATKPDESVLEKPPSSYNKIQFFPILVDTTGYFSDEPPPTGTHTILEWENLTIEDVSHLITPATFSLWKKDCLLSKDIASALDSVKYAIVHRYCSPTERHAALDAHSSDLINLAVACLTLVRPTAKSNAMNVRGLITEGGTFEPQGFSATYEPVEVPEVQKLFTVRKKDIDLLSAILPEFIQLYQKDGQGKLKDEYEPLRMAAQLYEQAYALSYWKASHILWWAAVEALYGNNEDAAIARIYALFGNNNLVDGYLCSIYEGGDIPSCYNSSSDSVLHTLGEMVPLIYEVRNASAHGQKVPDSHFGQIAHPFGGTVPGLVALAEAVTFIIRKTVIEILKRGLREDFKDRDTRENFWLYEYGLDKKQSKKRLRQMNDSLRQELPSGPLTH
jgi:hypothetical protein